MLRSRPIRNAFATSDSRTAAKLGFAARCGTVRAEHGSYAIETTKERMMGKGILLWLLGIPIPLIILFLLFWH